MSRVVPWFPVVGAVDRCRWSAQSQPGCGTSSPPLVAAAVAIAVGLLITGAFHEDGLGDIADAFGGGWTVERRLEILQRPASRHLRRGRDVLVDPDPRSSRSVRYRVPG